MRVRWLRAVAILGLLLPLSVIPPSPSAPDAEPVDLSFSDGAAEPALDADTDARPEMLYAELLSTGTLVLQHDTLSKTALMDSEAAGPVDEFRIRFFRANDASIEGAAAAASDEATEAESTPVAAESAPMIWVASAQGMLAALGGAMHAASESMVVKEVAAGFATVPMPQELSMAPPAAWMVAAFWSVFLTALGALLFPRLAGIGAVSLYARLVQSQMERHPRRAVVLGLIRSEPGVNVASLERQSGISGGVLRHHLDQLESHGLVRRVHSGRATHWFPATGLPVTAPPTLAQRRVLEVLGQAPGITVREVAVRLDVTVQNAWKQLRRLDANRMVRSERAGRATRWAVFA